MTTSRKDDQLVDSASGVARRSPHRDIWQQRIGSTLSLPETGFVRISQILFPGPIPISKSCWWAGVKTGRFPKPIKLGPRIALWRVEEIRELIDILSSEGSDWLPTSSCIKDVGSSERRNAKSKGSPALKPRATQEIPNPPSRSELREIGTNDPQQSGSKKPARERSSD